MEDEGMRKSHPAWGAWIEICNMNTILDHFSRRTPHGVRGLKLFQGVPSVRGGMSHPAWGAWIEIGAYISFYYYTSSRTPHGVRGLKSPTPRQSSPLQGVAPRMGCVD